jgi:hypothetical protein
VKPERLGSVGPNAFPNAAYARSSRTVKFGSIPPLAEIPFIVETWAEPTRALNLSDRLREPDPNHG